MFVKKIKRCVYTPLLDVNPEGDNNFMNRFVSIVDDLKSGNRMIIVGGELGFGCILKVFTTLKNAIERGVRFLILGGPFILVSEKDKKNMFVEYLLDTKSDTSNVDVGIALDFNKSADFHFSIFGSDFSNLLIEHPHDPSDGGKSKKVEARRTGMLLENSKKWKRRFNNYLRYLVENNYEMIDLTRKYVDSISKTRNDFIVIEKSEKYEYKNSQKGRLAFFHETDGVTIRSKSKYKPLRPSLA